MHKEFALKRCSFSLPLNFTDIPVFIMTISMCVCVCEHACTLACVCKCTYVCVCMHASVRMSASVHMCARISHPKFMVEPFDLDDESMFLCCEFVL